jgi:hypothetical protein
MNQREYLLLDVDISPANALGIRGILFQDNLSLFSEFKIMGLLS